MELSSYASSLLSVDKDAYMQKLNQCGLKSCPYIIRPSEFATDGSDLPGIRFDDMFVYLIWSSSKYTTDTVKAYKSLHGSNEYLQAGWIQKLSIHKFKTTHSEYRFLTLGLVSHSQKANADPLQPWFVCKQSGEILGAHCTCVAGLGEFCSHVAAIMLALVKNYEKSLANGVYASTSKACIWLPDRKHVTPAKLTEIDFRTPKAKECGKKKTTSPRLLKCLESVKEPSRDELENFFARLDNIEAKHMPALLRVVDNYAPKLKPKNPDLSLPKPIIHLFDERNVDLDFAGLLDLSKSTMAALQISEEEIGLLEQKTRDQVKSPLWNLYRRGLVTGSNFHQAAQSTQAMPPISLVKRICHPQDYYFSTAATRWGTENEKNAVAVYKNQQKKHHINLTVNKCGLFLSKSHPYIGATPDALVACDCCGKGVLEIKCPYSCKEDLPHPQEADKFYMRKVDGQWHLKTCHPYYLQVQTQLFVCSVDYADFVVWTKNNIAIERIKFDSALFYSKLECVKSFYVNGVLPEIIGKWFTRQRAPLRDVNIVNRPENRLYCYCRKPESATMIACEGINCKFEWFHVECLQMKRIPKGSWFCAECRKNETERKRKRGKENTDK